MINIGDIVTLNDNKKYVVVNLTNYNNNFFVYIANINNTDDTKIALYKNMHFIIINDEFLISELENIFSKNYI